VRFPYLLPNVICIGFVSFGILAGVFFLEETHEDKKHRFDPGIALRKRVSSLFRGNASSFSEKSGSLGEMESLFQDRKPLDYEVIKQRKDPNRYAYSKAKPTAQTPPFRQVFTRQVVLNVVAYGILAL
jgi:hypothetical protein